MTDHKASAAIRAAFCCGMKAVIGHVGADSFEFIEPISKRITEEIKS